MDYLFVASIGLLGMVGVVLDRTAHFSRADRHRNASARRKQRPRPTQGYEKSNRILLVERDEAQLQAVQAALGDASNSLDIDVVATQHDALDLLSVSAEFSPERIPDVLILGAGVAKHDNTYPIMRFIHDDDRFEQMRVFSYRAVSPGDDAGGEDAGCRELQPLRQLERVRQHEAQLVGSCSC